VSRAWHALILLFGGGGGGAREAVPPLPPYDKVSETIEFQTFACKAPYLNELDGKYKKTKEHKMDRDFVYFSSIFKDSRLGITTMPTVFNY
jgi:hypothetical protein